MQTLGNHEQMRIAIIILEFPALNETFILDHITGLLDRGHDVHIFATAPKGEAKVHGEIERYHLLGRTVYRDSKKFIIPNNRLIRVLKAIPLLAHSLLANPRSTFNSLNIFRFGRAAASLAMLYEMGPFLIKSGRYDIVHGHFPGNGELAVRMRDIGAITGKIVTHFHSYHMHLIESGKKAHLFPDLFKKGDLFLTNGEHSKRFFDQVGWGGGKMIIHRLGVSVGLFNASKPRLSAGEQVRLLSVGRLVEKKGFEYSIQGVAKVLKSFPNVQYEIAGDGPLRSSLEKLVAELGVANNIKLLGFQTREEVLRLLRAANIFLAPCVTSDGRSGTCWVGDVETGPVVVLEAMASGMPIISTRHTGIPEMVHDGESGFLLEERDVDGIADRLTHLLKHPEIWQGMGQKGRNHVEEYHNLDKQTDRLVEIYRQLLEEDHRGLQPSLNSNNERSRTHSRSLNGGSGTWGSGDH